MAEVIYNADSQATAWEDIHKEIKDTLRYRYVVGAYVSNNLRLRYRRSFLGFFWSVLAPLLNYLVVGLVFSFAARNQIPNFFAYFFSGSVFFQLFQAIITKSPYIMIENENYIRKIYVPKLAYVCCTIALEGLNFFLGLGVLLILGLAIGYVTLNVGWLILPFVVVLGLLFLSGISCFLSVSGVFFRDIAHITPFIMQTLFFITPILYPESLVPERYRIFVDLNPLYYFIQSFRRPLLGEPIDWNHFAIITVLALASFVLGLVFLKRYDNKIVFKL
jgi:ABC-type polysaccharide/polyol phosphate export permease